MVQIGPGSGAANCLERVIHEARDQLRSSDIRVSKMKTAHHAKLVSYDSRAGTHDSTTFLGYFASSKAGSIEGPLETRQKHPTKWGTREPGRQLRDNVFVSIHMLRGGSDRSTASAERSFVQSFKSIPGTSNRRNGLYLKRGLG